MRALKSPEKGLIGLAAVKSEAIKKATPEIIKIEISVVPSRPGLLLGAFGLRFIVFIVPKRRLNGKAFR